MPNRQPQRSPGKRADTARDRSKRTAAAGISKLPPVEEERQQEKLPPRGQAKKKTPGGKA